MATTLPERISRWAAELRRRHVFRVAAVYGVVALAVMAAASDFFPALRLPDWTVTLVAVLLLIGFPVALVLAWAFEITAGGVRRAAPRHDAAPADPGSHPGRSGPGGRRARWLIPASLVVLTVAGLAVVPRRGVSTDDDVDARIVAVLPFRVSGAAAELSYLREGMIDLLAATLTGEAGPRAGDPRAVLAALRAERGTGADLPVDSGAALAARLGMGQVLQGAVVGTSSMLTLSAELRDARTGRVRARASAAGPADSLPSLVERLAAGLLAREAGLGAAGEAALGGVPLPALRDYLAGQAALRDARFGEAVHRFGAALAHDSTFALAALGYASAGGWTAVDAPGFSDARARRLAWQQRGRLGPTERLLLDVLVGPRYPEPASLAERVEVAGRAAESAPDRAELWYFWGDLVYHYGRLVGQTETSERAASAFRRALRVDPDFGPALHHVFEIEALAGDTVTATGLAARYLALDSAGRTADYVRWHMAHLRDDTAGLRNLRAGWRDADPELLRLPIFQFTQWGGFALEDAEAAVTELQRRAETPGQQRAALRLEWVLALNRGQPGRAGRALDGMRTTGVSSWWQPDWLEIWGAIYWGGDTGAAVEAAGRLERTVAAPLPATETALRLRSGDACLLAQWRAVNGHVAAAAAALERMEEVAQAFEEARPHAAFCELMVQAVIADAEERPDAATLAARLDSVALTAPPVSLLVTETANLLLVRLHELQGRTGAALAAARRRHLATSDPHFLSTFLHEEGRLATLTGDTAAAIRAYSHYLALRSDAEPAAMPEIERVRVQLSRLTGEAAATVP